MTSKEIERAIEDHIDALYTNNYFVIDFGKEWIKDNPDHWYELKTNYGLNNVSDEVALKRLILTEEIFNYEPFNTDFIKHCRDTAEYKCESMIGGLE